MTDARIQAGEPDYLKWAFFALMAAFTLLVIYVDEQFLIDSNDPTWEKFESFKWLLLPHGVFGALALLIGPFQFSTRLRTRRPDLHRWTGRVYVGAVAIASLVAMYIGSHYEPREIYIEQYFQSGLWFLATAIALACILRRQIARHKVWMMRSYGFCCIFVLARVPDAFTRLSEQQLADVLWSLVVAALIVPDLLHTLRDLQRSRGRTSGGGALAQAAE